MYLRASGSPPSRFPSVPPALPISISDLSSHRITLHTLPSPLWRSSDAIYAQPSPARVRTVGVTSPRRLAATLPRRRLPGRRHRGLDACSSRRGPRCHRAAIALPSRLTRWQLAASRNDSTGPVCLSVPAAVEGASSLRPPAGHPVRRLDVRPSAVRARPERLGGLSVLPSISGLYGGFYGRAGCLTAENGGFRPGQMRLSEQRPGDTWCPSLGSRRERARYLLVARTRTRLFCITTPSSCSMRASSQAVALLRGVLTPRRRLRLTRSSQDVVVITPVVIATALAGGAEGAHLRVPPRRAVRRRVVLGPH
jgi:hypothetical protein